jgi:hypothetical protein
MIINFSNVEKNIFENEELRRILYIKYNIFFSQWIIGKQVPSLKQVAKKALFDFLNNFKEEDLPILEKHFNEKITIEKLNYDVIKSLKIPINEICDFLDELEGFNYFTTSRDADYIYILGWR